MSYKKTGFILILICVLLLFINIIGIRFYIMEKSNNNLIKEGSLLVNIKEDIHNVEVNDIITYKLTNTKQYVTQKVIEYDKEKKQFLCESEYEVWVDQNKYVSTNLFSIPYLGTFVNYLNSIEAVIIIGLLIFIVGKSIYVKGRM